MCTVTNLVFYNENADWLEVIGQVLAVEIVVRMCNGKNSVAARIFFNNLVGTFGDNVPENKFSRTKNQRAVLAEICSAPLFCR